MLAFDASSMLYAWDNYPVEQFPGLWDWMTQRVAEGLIQMSEVAVDEVSHKAPECAAWMRQAGLQKLAVTEAILTEAMRIKDLLGIEGEAYGSGVDENDLLIIATAKLHGCELVTNEAFQATPAKQKRNWRIPAVCIMDTVGVSPIDFLRYLKRSEAVFR